VAEAARNVVCSGAKPLAITNCLNFGNPYKPEVYWTFSEAIRGMSDACRAFNTPVTGGNVSFYNENPNGAIYPTPVIGMLGLIENHKKVITQYFKNQGDIVYLIGKECHEIGGSEYLKTIHGKISGMPPLVNLSAETRLYKLMLNLADNELLNSAHDCSDGGLAVCIAECCFASDSSHKGVKLDFTVNGRKDIAYFGEAHSRIVVSVSPENESGFTDIAKEYECEIIKLGKVTSNNFILNDDVSLPIPVLYEYWQNAIQL
jgi:phosphoribosylformylglycinamidine synthase